MKNMKNQPAWTYVIPFIGLTVGTVLGFVFKKKWGYALGAGFFLMGITSIPLIYNLCTYDVRIKGKDGDTKQTLTAKILAALKELSALTGKQEAYDQNKEQIEKAVSELNEKEQRAVLDLVSIGLKVSQNKAHPDVAAAHAISETNRIKTVYGEDFLNDLTKKVSYLEQQFGIRLKNA